MASPQDFMAKVRGLVTANQQFGNPNSVPVVDQIVQPIRSLLPQGVANYAASELPMPGQSNTNIPPRPSFVMTGRIPIGLGKTPASMGTLGTGRVQAIGALTRPKGK